MRLFNIALSSVMALFLAGCGSNSTESNDEVSQNINPAGIWIGHQHVLSENGKGAFDMKSIIYDGKFYGISEDAGLIYSGAYEMSTGKYLMANSLEDSNTSYKAYDINDNGKVFANGVTALSITQESHFSGTFANDLYQEGNLESVYSELYSKTSSLEYVQKTLDSENLKISVDENGLLSGTKKECVINGNLSVPDKSRNIYKIDFTLSECDDSGVYTGLGIVALDSNNSAYFMSFATSSDESRMDVISYYLDNTPDEFIQEKEKRASALIQVVAEILNPDHVQMNKDFSNKNARDFDWVNYSQRKDGYIYHNYYKIRSYIYDSSNFSNFDFTLVENRTNHYYIKSNSFEGADFSSARFTNSGETTINFVENTFDNANFEGSDIDKVKFKEVFLDFLHVDNKFSSAWWVDGRRCGVLSDNECSSRLIDTDLTYEEYKSNKYEVEKLGENIIEKSSELAKDAKEFAESVGSEVKDIGSEVLSWRPSW